MTKSRKRLQAVRLLLAASMICLLCGAGWDRDRIWAFDIPRQNVSTALSALAQQTGTQLLFPYDQVSSQEANPLAGRYTLDQALEVLLRDTGLVGGVTGSGVITISLETWAKNRDQGDNMGREKKGILAGVAAAVLSVFSGQQAAGQEGAEAQTGRGAPVFEEIIVTAQKREESLKKVPISISVLRGEDLDNSTAEGFIGALNRVPGVITTAPIQGGTAQIAMRGVTSGAGFQSGSSPIAYYLDSVPFGLVKTALVPDSNAYDLERIEVLRGPQGTLYGASAQNGVVRVLTHDADLNAFELKARTSVSATQHAAENYRGDLAINVPIIEGKLAARAVLGYQDLSGWIDKPGNAEANDVEQRTMRLKVSAQPTDALSIGLSAWRSVSDFGAPSAADENRRRSAAADESIASDYDVFGLNLVYDFAGFSVASMTAYLDYEFESDLDFFFPLAGVPGVLFTGMESRIVSQEVVLNSTHDGPWRWSAGGMYRDGEDRLVQTLFIFAGPINFSDTSESFAVFGELTRQFLDGRFEVTAGLRYFEDDVTHIENSAQPPAAPTDPVLPPDSTTFDATSPRIVLAYHPDSNSTVYASYSEGFRSGFSQNANIKRLAPGWPPLEPDTLKNYELGAKGGLLDGRVSYDAAVYFIDWRDVQQALTVDFDGAPLAALVNGESASGMGAEFALNAQFSAQLQLGVNFSWNNLEADRAFVSPPDFDITGLYVARDRLNFSSEYTAGATMDYAFPLGGSAYEGHFSASANYSSEQTYRNILAGAVVVDVGEPQLIARTSFAIKSPNRWAATLFIDNVNNEQDPGVGLFHVPDWTQRVRPRTVGLQFEYNFE